MLIRPALRPRLPFFAAVLFIFIVAGCGGESASTAQKSEKKAPPALRAALIFDEGGLGDRSFNDMAHAGTQRAEKELRVEAERVEPSKSSDRVTYLHHYSSEGDFDVIVCVGFLFTEEVRKIAPKKPKVKFACVDYSLQDGEKLPDNLAAIRFREQEGSFLVGAIAALTSKTGIIGFVGGAESALIRKFEKGYVAGAQHVRPDIDVKVAYAGVTGAAFSDPTKGKQLALAMIDEKADVIFHAAGTTGLGVFNAAKERGIYAIGVDADQSDPKEYPNVILTSMLKRTDEAVFQVLKGAVEKQTFGGLREFGLKEGGIGYVYNDSNKNLISKGIIDQVEALKAKIIAGEIIVPKE